MERLVDTQAIEPARLAMITPSAPASSYSACAHIAHTSSSIAPQAAQNTNPTVTMSLIEVNQWHGEGYVCFCPKDWV